MKPRILVPLLVLLAVAIGAFFVIQSRNDGTDPELAAGGEAPAAGAGAPTEATDGQPEQQAAAPAEPPVFELVRVEPTGDLVAAGLAAAGSGVELLAGNDVLAKTTATSTGEWALVLDEPLPIGSHDLALRSIPQGGGEPVYGDRVAIVISETGETPLVAVTSEGQPSRVVQQPGSDEDETEIAASEEPAEQELAMAGDAAGGGDQPAPRGDQAAAGQETERPGGEGVGAAAGTVGQPGSDAAPAGGDDVAAADNGDEPGPEENADVAAGDPTASPGGDAGASEREQVASVSEGEAEEDGTTPRLEPDVATAGTGPDAGPVDASPPIEQRPADAGPADGEAAAGDPMTSPGRDADPSEREQLASASEDEGEVEEDGTAAGLEADSTAEVATADAGHDVGQVDASQPVEQRLADAGPADGEAGAPGTAARSAEIASRDPADATRERAPAGVAGAAGEAAPGSSVDAPEIAVAEEAEREQASQNVATAAPEPGDLESRSTAADGPASDVPAAALGNEGDVTIETVEVEEPNRLMMSGETEPDRPVRVYVNNERVGEVQADAAGNWFLTAAREMPPGNYEVRADAVDDRGQVTARSAVRFDRVQVAFAGEGAASGAEAGAPAAQGEGSGSAGTGTGGGAAGDAAIVMINRGDNLWTIARKLYGEGVRYTVIYDANRNQIRNPSLIYPGQVFTLPELQEEPAEPGSEG